VAGVVQLDFLGSWNF